MSSGPVYCPNDKSELEYRFSPVRGFVCSQCGLLWHGQFPIRDEREPEESDNYNCPIHGLQDSSDCARC